MRRTALAALAASLLCAAPAQARLFYQTYGATVATGDGGCVWNINQDYFVPRHCHTGRYDLFSACKTSRTTSAACRHGHPLYSGYCSPYGPCRYRWRDHVYKKHCGCTPLSCYYGPWRPEYAGCCKPPLMRLRHDCGGKHACRKKACRAGDCRGECSLCPASTDYVAHGPIGGPIANVEGYELEVLGTIAADAESLLVGATVDGAARAISDFQSEVPRGRMLPNFGIPRSLTSPSALPGSTGL